MEVVCGILEDGDKILLARRAPGMALAGIWEFPGGKIEPGESAPMALQRELQEELKIRCEVFESVGKSSVQWKGQTVTVEAFRARVIEGTPTISVHDRVVWVTPEEARGMILAEADVPLLESYIVLRRRNLPHFF